MILAVDLSASGQATARLAIALSGDGLSPPSVFLRTQERLTE